jgi:hypothetical protein
MPSHTTFRTSRLRTIKAFIIYDDLASAKRTVAALKRTTHRAKIAVHWDLKPWRLDILSLPLGGDEALLEAADADIIAFGGPRASSPPLWLTEWLECWAGLRQVGDVALTVVGEREKDFGRAAFQLSRFANAHGLSLLLGNGSALEHGLAPQSVLSPDWRCSVPARNKGAIATATPGS